MNEEEYIKHQGKLYSKYLRLKAKNKRLREVLTYAERFIRIELSDAIPYVRQEGFKILKMVQDAINPIQKGN